MPLDGIDLIPLRTSDSKPIDRTFFWRIDRSNRKQKAIRHGKWKYINDGNAMDLLFDLEADIGERTNLGYQHPEIVEDLQKRCPLYTSDAADDLTRGSHCASSVRSQSTKSHSTR